jgi:hypothetical protein
LADIDEGLEDKRMPLDDISGFFFVFLVRCASLQSTNLATRRQRQVFGNDCFFSVSNTCLQVHRKSIPAMAANLPAWDYYPEYRIRSDVLQLWLQYIFQDGNITVQVSECKPTTGFLYGYRTDCRYCDRGTDTTTDFSFHKP